MTMTWTDTLNIHITLKSVQCCTCGVPFAMPAQLLEQFHEHEDRWFYCPLGHQQHFTDTETARLRRQLKQEQERLAQARLARRDAEVALEAEQRAHQRTKRQARQRARAGLCPVDGCRRHFDNLDRHLHQVHPDYVADQVRIDGPYGSMQVVARRRGKPIYGCACGFKGSTAAGYAARHARTCPKARAQ
jgi:hypothetical protein